MTLQLKTARMYSVTDGTTWHVRISEPTNMQEIKVIYLTKYYHKANAKGAIPKSIIGRRMDKVNQAISMAMWPHNNIVPSTPKVFRYPRFSWKLTIKKRVCNSIVAILCQCILMVSITRQQVYYISHINSKNIRRTKVKNLRKIKNAQLMCSIYMLTSNPFTCLILYSQYLCTF